MSTPDDFDDSGDFLDDAGDCPNCGGEGVIYMCVSEYACIDPEGGCDLCERPCDWCRPRRPTLQEQSPCDTLDAAGLAPCPFCGGGAVLMPPISNERDPYVACGGGTGKYACDAQGPSAYTEAEATDAWNRRATPPVAPPAPTGDEIAELRAQLDQAASTRRRMNDAMVELASLREETVKVLDDLLDDKSTTYAVRANAARALLTKLKGATK